MNSTNPEFSTKPEVETPTEESPESSQNKTPLTSATTTDQPDFGWSNYAERVNGRFAMIGFTAILIIEALTKQTFLSWAGLFN